MKKIILVALCLFMLVGCENRNNKEDNSRELVISLDSNPTTGYDWVYEDYDESIISIKEEYDSSCEDGMVGCGGVKKYTITPLKEGVTPISFSYERSFEDNSSIYNASYVITVDKDLNITEHHEGTYFLEKENISD